MAKTPRKRKTRKKPHGNPLVPRHREGRAIGRARGRKRSLGPAPVSSGDDEDGGSQLVRLNKFLADHGVASRRKCDELIEAGKVSIDGEPVTELGTKVDPDKQTVDVGGVTLKGLPRRYYVLNKPSGVVCTNEEREQRPRAVDLIADRDKGRIYTVGRLDEESTGLILLTNDGEFANRVMHPRYGVHKTYSVRVAGRIDDEALNKVRDGVHLAEGRTGGARILVKRRGRDSSTLDVTIREGMNREIRRAFAGVGYKVVALRRTRIGPLDARGLKTGRWRKLTRKEIDLLLDPPAEDVALHTPRGPDASSRKPRPVKAGKAPAPEKSAPPRRDRRQREDEERPTRGRRDPRSRAGGGDRSGDRRGSWSDDGPRSRTSSRDRGGARPDREGGARGGGRSRSGTASRSGDQGERGSGGGRSRSSYGRGRDSDRDARTERGGYGKGYGRGASGSSRGGSERSTFGDDRRRGGGYIDRRGQAGRGGDDERRAPRAGGRSSTGTRGGGARKSDGGGRASYGSRSSGGARGAGRDAGRSTGTGGRGTSGRGTGGRSAGGRTGRGRTGGRTTGGTRGAGGGRRSTGGSGGRRR